MTDNISSTTAIVSIQSMNPALNLTMSQAEHIYVDICGKDIQKAIQHLLHLSMNIKRTQKSPTQTLIQTQSQSQHNNSGHNNRVRVVQPSINHEFESKSSETTNTNTSTNINANTHENASANAQCLPRGLPRAAANEHNYSNMHMTPILFQCRVNAIFDRLVHGFWRESVTVTPHARNTRHKTMTAPPPVSVLFIVLSYFPDKLLYFAPNFRMTEEEILQRLTWHISCHKHNDADNANANANDTNECNDHNNNNNCSDGRAGDSRSSRSNSVCIDVSLILKHKHIYPEFFHHPSMGHGGHLLLNISELCMRYFQEEYEHIHIFIPSPPESAADETASLRECDSFGFDPQIYELDLLLISQQSSHTHTMQLQNIKNNNHKNRNCNYNENENKSSTDELLRLQSIVLHIPSCMLTNILNHGTEQSVRPFLNDRWHIVLKKDKHARPSMHLISAFPLTIPTFDHCSLAALLAHKVGVLGPGGFASVSLVKDPNTQRTYALKKLRKNRMIETNQQIHVQRERALLSILRRQNKNKQKKRRISFLCGIFGSFQDKFNVYLLLEPVLGGELFTLLRYNKKFPERTARFYAGCVVLALEELQSSTFDSSANGIHVPGGGGGACIIHRRIYPESLLIQSNGYLKLTDFIFAKFESDTRTLSGVPQYLAPEILQDQRQTRAVDLWCLGILLYEMVVGYEPFRDDHSTSMYEKVLTMEVQFPAVNVYDETDGRACARARARARKTKTKAKQKTKKKRQLTHRVINLIHGLLRKKPKKRLTLPQVMAHAWFKGLNWAEMRAQTVLPPYVPRIESNEDLHNFEPHQESDVADTLLTEEHVYDWCQYF